MNQSCDIVYESYIENPKLLHKSSQKVSRTRYPSRRSWKVLKGYEIQCNAMGTLWIRVCRIIYCKFLEYKGCKECIDGRISSINESISPRLYISYTWILLSYEMHSTMSVIFHIVFCSCIVHSLPVLPLLTTMVGRLSFNSWQLVLSDILINF